MNSQLKLFSKVSVITLTVFILTSTFVSKTAMADEIITSNNAPHHSYQSASPELTLAAIDSVQGRVERQVNQQLDMFIQAVDTSLTKNLDVITTSIVSQ